jgi:hypothetical protein
MDSNESKISLITGAIMQRRQRGWLTCENSANNIQRYIAPVSGFGAIKNVFFSN